MCHVLGTEYKNLKLFLTVIRFALIVHSFRLVCDSIVFTVRLDDIDVLYIF